MNVYSLANVRDLWFLAGWTMVHFLWLGAIVAVAALIARAVLRNASPVVRYTIALGCLLTLAALPIATAAGLTKYSAPLKGGAGGGIAPTMAQSTLATPPTPVAPAPQVIELHVADSPLASTPAENAAAIAPLHAAQPAAPGSARGSLTPPLQAPNAQLAPLLENPRQSRGLYSFKQPGTFADLNRRIEAYVAYLPWLWLVGTPLTFVLLVSGLVGTRRLGRASQPIEATDPITDLLAHLASSLRISRRVTVAVCERVAAPVLIGIVRPMILLPPAAITGWSPDEIEMVLLHELAHVRRWDNLVNLLERCIESLLFFHPAVWFVSSWVRHEREACCDALVVDRTNRPHAYAELIVALAAQLPRSVLFHPAASSAMAAGPLRSRIRRILKLEDDPMLISGKSLAMLIASAVVATALAFYLPTTGHADQPDDAAKPDSAPAEFANTIRFEKGKNDFLGSDEIVVEEVRGTASTFEPGNKYWIRGHYNLRSHDAAQLVASVTPNIPTANPAAIADDQTKKISRGDAPFTLMLSISVRGCPHINFQSLDKGASFGEIYFGVGETLLAAGSLEPAKTEGVSQHSQFATNSAAKSADNCALTNHSDSSLPTFRRTTADIEQAYLNYRGQQSPPGTSNGQTVGKKTGFYQWIFTVNDANPILTQKFGVDPKWHDELNKQFESLSKESWWKPEFTSKYVWSADGSTVDVTAPKTVQDMLQNQLEELETGVVHPPGPLYQTAQDRSLFAHPNTERNLIDRKVEAQSRNDLRNIALGLLMYEGQHHTLPPYASFSKDGKPLLSWRVLILPFVGEQQLYSEFHLDESWDSAHNRELIDRMPAVYKNPKLGEPGKTNYLAVVGPECVFNGTANGVRLAEITNGLSNTIAVVEANKEFAAAWTNPADWSFDLSEPTRGLGRGSLWPYSNFAAYVDGSIKPIDVAKPANEISSHFVRSGGEPASPAATSPQPTTPAAEQAFNFELKRNDANSDHATLILNHAAIDDDSIRRMIAAHAGSLDDIPVSLIAEKGVGYGDVMKAVDRLEGLGIKKLALNPGASTEEATTDAAKELERARFEHFENSLKSIELVIAVFNDSAGYTSQLESVYKTLAKEHHSLNLWGLMVGAESPDAKRYQLGAAPTCIVFYKGKETSRMAPITDAEQLKQFVERAARDASLPKRDEVSATDESDTIARAWRILRIRLEHTSKENALAAKLWPGYEVKVIALAPPSSLPLTNGPKILRRMHTPRGDADTKTFQDVANVLGKLKDKDEVEINCLVEENPPRQMDFIVSVHTDSTAIIESASPTNKFPSLEDQKLADVAWKMLGLELEPLGEPDLKRVKALGYAGGVSIASRNGDRTGIYPGDILVGLHAWPTTSIRDVATILARDDIASLSPLKFYVVRAGSGGPGITLSGRITVQSVGAQGFPMSTTSAPVDAPSRSQDIFDVTGPLSDHDLQRYNKALQKRIDAETARLHAKDRDSIEAAIESVAAADRELEIVKRDLNKKSAEQPTRLQANSDKWPVNNAPAPRNAPSTAQNATAIPYTTGDPWSRPMLYALPGETTPPELPRSQAEFDHMQLERMGQIAGIPPQNGSPQTQWPESQAPARILPKPTPEELEILRDRVQTIDDEYKFTVERNKAGKGATDLDVARVACDLAEAKSEAAFAEGNFDAAIKQLNEARDHAETAVKICSAGARAGDSNDFESVIKAKRKLSDIKLKLVRLQNPPYVAPKAPANASPNSAPPSPSSQNRYPSSLQALTDASTQPAILSIGTATLPANRPSNPPVTNSPAVQSTDPVADANAPLTSSPTANQPTESAAAPQQIMGEPANAPLSAPRESSRLVVPQRYPANGAPAKTLAEQPFFLQFFYLRDDAEQLKLAERLQNESAPQLRDKYPVGVAFVGTKADDDHSLPNGQKVEVFPTYVLYFNGKVVQQLYGAQTTEQISRAIDRVKNESAPTAKQNPSPSEKPILRYDGKPFSVWSSVFQTELSTEKRLEAVKALAAFARAGYQSEATDVVLETVPQYDFSEISEGNPEGRLKTILIELFTRGIPAQYWLKLLRERYDANPTSWATFADAVVPEASYSFDPATRELRQKFLVKLAEGENGLAAALTALVSSDPTLTNLEIKALILKDLKGNQTQLAIAIRSLGSAVVVLPELTEILLHGDEPKQITARAMLEQLGGGSLCSAVANSMNEILKDKTRQKDYLAAIRTLAALGASVQDPDIEKSLREVSASGGDAEKIAVACAFERITNGASQAGNMIQSSINVNEKNAPDIAAALETEKRTILGRKW